ncbi:uncharacterized protein BJX67DRAFT_380982 [Aspergillus lucknowensis]|uniref:Uncharacterized protein n=1 Tax=Aspergillus lucknowensis TaxID=176173 RepID=A0ABR4LSW5_9EURO
MTSFIYQAKAPTPGQQASGLTENTDGSLSISTGKVVEVMDMPRVVLVAPARGQSTADFNRLTYNRLKTIRDNADASAPRPAVGQERYGIWQGPDGVVSAGLGVVTWVGDHVAIAIVE